jgi:uncharacterized protein YycO
MKTYRTLVDSILQLLNSGNSKNLEAVVPLANQYAEAIDKTNRRLQSCEAYLREGSRSEAIRECEEKPNLLDLFTLLDFPRNAEWEAVIQSHNLLPPDKLIGEVAQELNLAYDKEGEINSLLKSHRLLALARRPIVERLPVLRELAKVDPNQMHWETDVRTMEKVRLSEIEKEVLAAFRKGDSKHLLMLERELSSSPWLEVPSRSLQKDVRRYSTKIRAEKAMKELVQLAKQLNDAYTAQDVELGRTIRSRWQATLRLSEVGSNHKIVEQAADAIAWLAEMDDIKKKDSDYQQALAQMTELLDNEASQANLERLYAAIVRFEREIPETLKRRVNERFRSLKESEEKRWKIIFSSGIAILIVFGAITWFSISRYQFNRQVAGHLANVKGLLNQGELEEVGAYLNKLETKDSNIFVRPEIQKINLEWKDATESEDLRAAKVRTLIAGVQTQIKAGDWTALQAANSSLSNAKKIIQPGEEENKIGDLKQQISKKQKAIQDEINDNYAKEFEAWEKKIQLADRSNADELLTLGNAGWSLLDKGKGSTPPVSKHYQSLTSNLATKVGSWRKSAALSVDSQKALKQLDRAIGNTASFSSQFQQYRTRFLSGQDNDLFAKQTEADIEAYQAIQKINDLLDRISATPLSKISPEAAEDIIKKCNAVLSQNTGHPIQQSISKYLKTLGSVSARKENGVWITDTLNSVLGKPLIIRLNSLIVRDKEEILQYYFFSEDNPKPPYGAGKGAWKTDAFVDYDLEDKKAVIVKQINILNAKLNDNREGVAQFDWTSPQRKVAKMMLEKINRIKQGGDWELEFSGIIEDLNNEPYLEPLLKIQLLQVINEIAAKGSGFMQTALEPELKLLENIPIDFNAEWIWPRDEEGKNARAQATIILQQVRSLKPVFEKMQAERKTFEKGLNKRLDWIGYLWNNTDNGSDHWECRTADVDPQLTGDVCILLPDESGSKDEKKMTLKKVGKIASGAIVLSEMSSTGLTLGRPVYFLRKVSL